MNIVLPTWLGGYFGSDYSFETYEKLTLTSFDEGSRLKESECMDKRWFDYIRLHPLQATYYLVSCYASKYISYYKKYIDADASPTGIKDPNFLHSRECRTFWNLRQFCDLEGFEYEWLIDTFMEYRLVSGEFKHRLPRPCHLMPKNEIELQAVRTLWRMHNNGEVLRTAKDPYFLIFNWEGDPQQQRYEAFLIEQIKGKEVKRFALKDYVYNRQILRLEAVLKHFPDEVREIQR